ncbi:MAG: aminotransferase class V-fold PLP-dependent enzyme [Phycisphaerales bacterium]|nr:aminotransferase class V-fold PLP-dependent enzyme [Phycisphaerales bacterium]
MAAQPFVYLDHAATSWPKAPGVAEAMSKFLAEDAGNPGRGGHALAQAAQRVMDETRAGLAKLVNAESPDRIVLTYGCTDALNLAIHGVVTWAHHHTNRPVGLVISSVEHNAVGRTADAHRCEGTADLRMAQCDDEGFVSPEAVLAQCDEHTVLVCMTHASNVLGTIQPISEVGAALRERFPDALFLVDAAQTTAVLPIDVRAMGIDLLAMGIHKGLRGPTGIGALYVGPRVFPDEGEPRLVCCRQGGTGALSRDLTMPQRLPSALEAGTPNTVGMAGTRAALRSVDFGSIEHERGFLARVRARFAGDPRVTFYGPAEAGRRTAVLAMNVHGHDPRELAAVLDSSFGIATRAGLLCSPLCHQSLGTYPDGVLRISVGPQSTEADVDAFCGALESVLSTTPAAARPVATS